MWWLAFLAAASAASPADEIVAAFTPRHVAPSCDTVAPGWPPEQRLAAFVEVAEGVAVPPWVPVAAAACVAESAEDPVAFAAVARWIDDPTRAGLAFAAVGRLDVLPADTATRLAEVAVRRGAADARFGAWVFPPLEASVHDSVRRVAEPSKR